MEILKTLIWVVQIIAAVGIIILVLLQHGKGADAGATFGSGGGSGSLFGANGSSNFLSRTTAIFATVFFITTFGLVLLTSSGSFGGAGVMADMNNKTVASGTATASSPATASAPKGVASSNAKGQKNQIPN